VPGIGLASCPILVPQEQPKSNAEKSDLFSRILSNLFRTRGTMLEQRQKEKWKMHATDLHGGIECCSTKANLLFGDYSHAAKWSIVSPGERHVR
jgi:hypothetical protein